MYISKYTIDKCLEVLEKEHPFYGVTFLAFKKYSLPIGESIVFDITGYENKILEQYYSPEVGTSWYFRVFRKSDRNKYWLKPDYASSGSQSTRTRQFKSVFIHPNNSQEWGWVEDYVQELFHLSLRYSNGKIPLIALAVWTGKEHQFINNTLDEIIGKFIFDFNITEEELSVLFDKDMLSDLNEDKFFSEEKFDWNKFRVEKQIPFPPDKTVDSGLRLLSLLIQDVGIAKSFDISFGDRLNLITGDNGLGKTFILEGAWWALTNNWVDDILYPYLESNLKPALNFEVINSINLVSKTESKFDHNSLKWDKKSSDFADPGIVVYSRTDGVFAIFDSLREIKGANVPNENTIILSKQDLWNGLSYTFNSKTKYICNGLISDWNDWQRSETDIFETFCDVLNILSPASQYQGDLGPLVPGESIRIAGESRYIPTLKHSYGYVPIIYASAAVQRILSLAYSLVWSWIEHSVSAKRMNIQPHSQLILLIDELESHLHPKWQRLILPSLMKVFEKLSKKLDVQAVISTHSPLVLASAEQFFNDSIDKLFHMEVVNEDATKVRVEEIDFVRYGSIDSWLTSEIFEMKQPHSIEAENVIEKGREIMLNKIDSIERIKEIHDGLIKNLAAHDKFWIQWNFYLNQKGIDIK